MICTGGGRCWDRLPEAWIAPPATRDLRGWVRHRAKLVGLRSNLKGQVHAVLAGAGVAVSMSDLFGRGGQQLLATARMAPESRTRIESALRLIENLDCEVELFAKLVAGRLRDHPGYAAIQHICGVGPVLAAVFVAEIVTSPCVTLPAQLALWAGLTPNTTSPTATVHRGRITKQGSKLVRWSAVEAVQRVGVHTRRLNPAHPSSRTYPVARTHRTRGWVQVVCVMTPARSVVAPTD